MTEPDYFAVNRRLIRSEMWTSEPFTRGQAWVDLIGLARWDDGPTSGDSFATARFFEKVLCDDGDAFRALNGQTDKTPIASVEVS